MNVEYIPSSLKKYISTIDSLKICTSKKGIQLEQIIPDIFWITDRPVQNIINLLCGYFSESRIIEFAGERQYIQVQIDEPSHEKSTSDICAKIHDLLSLAGGFHGEFKGVVHVDLNSVKHFRSDFIEIMKYIKTNTQGCLRIITGDFKEYQISNIKNALCNASYRIKTIRNDSLSMDKAMIFFKVKMDAYGFRFDTKAVDMIQIMLRQLSESHRINNIEGVSSLCDDILFFLLSEGCTENVSGNMIDLYFKQCILCAGNKKEKTKIGFLGSREV